MRRTKGSTQFPGRRFPDSVRRNWGYHDAINDKRIGNVPVWRRGPRDTHFDKVYVEGYYAGMSAANERSA